MGNVSLLLYNVHWIDWWLLHLCGIKWMSGYDGWRAANRWKNGTGLDENTILAEGLERAHKYCCIQVPDCTAQIWLAAQIYTTLWPTVFLQMYCLARVNKSLEQNTKWSLDIALWRHNTQELQAIIVCTHNAPWSSLYEGIIAHFRIAIRVWRWLIHCIMMNSRTSGVSIEYHGFRQWWPLYEGIILGVPISVRRHRIFLQLASTLWRHYIQCWAYQCMKAWYSIGHLPHLYGDNAQETTVHDYMKTLFPCV